MRFSPCKTLIISALILFSVSHAHAGLILNHPNYLELDKGLVGFWSFDGNTVVSTSTGSGAALDLSGHGYTAYFSHGASRAIGKIGQAL